MTENNEPMPGRLDQTLFVLGLIFYTVGQITINIFGAMTKDQSSIDFIHWFMLIGAALLIPFTARLPRKGLALLAGPLLLIGIILIIGMCVLDFVSWSLSDDDFRGKVEGQLSATPAVWQPFMKLAGYFFTPALALTSLLYWRFSKIGPLLAIAGMLVIGIWPIWSNIPGYIMITVGFLFNFRATER